VEKFETRVVANIISKDNYNTCWDRIRILANIRTVVFVT
jgi:hypothetical protein